jgi:23S rRNA (cytidine1920-2'-O)/16S rRNA (cytidine1409-2'-O)-methyltransferase
MTKSERVRLDELLVARGLAPSRSAARGLIMARLVRVDDQVSDKAGTLTRPEARVEVKQRPRFVSRGGEKLVHALEVFALDVTGASALDVGASTGGFVDCLLQAGAARVIALDVGRGQLEGGLRNDPRVFPLDRVNARYLTPEQLPFIPDLFTMDVSFISVTKVLPAVVGAMAPAYRGIVLMKPQFEAGPERVGKGGVVRDAAVHRDILLELGRFVIDHLEAELHGVTDSGLLGADGNREFFFYLSRGGEKGWGLDTLGRAVDMVVGVGDKTDMVAET